MSKVSEKFKTWRENPCQFVHENFGVEPDKWQVDALNAFASKDKDKTRISLQACAGPGKSAVLSWCGWNFLTCYGDIGEHPKGAAVSVTHDNLKDNLWPEFSKWQQRSEWMKRAFTWNKERICSNEHPETWFMSARSWSKKSNPEEQGRTLSGLHSKYVLALIDESGEIPVAVAKAAEQALSNCEFGKIMQAGNPTSLDGLLYHASGPLAHLWYVIRITGDPEDPNRSSRISVEWAKQQIETYGRDDPWVMSLILGMFPPASINSLLGVDEVDAAMNRHLRTDQYDYAQKRLGIDVARFGDDKTIIFPRQGLAAFKPVELRNAATHDIAARVVQAKTKWGSEVEMVDDTGGFGAGVIDSMMQAGHYALPVNFASKAIDARYANKRAEMWLEMRDWVKRGGALPKLPQLKRELTAATYSFSAGKFILEPKEKIKERLGFSPDYADALALTFATKDMPRFDSLEARFGNTGHKSEWNPMDY